LMGAVMWKQDEGGIAFLEPSTSCYLFAVSF
jgi:hypothetical protein